MSSLRLRSLQNDMDIGRESISANRNIVFSMYVTWMILIENY